MMNRRFPGSADGLAAERTVKATWKRIGALLNLLHTTGTHQLPRQRRIRFNVKRLRSPARQS
jgi:hypothetical protein